VYFFSLDAASVALVYGARLTYKLPYFRARMNWDGRHYASRRIHRGAPPAELRCEFVPAGPVFRAEAGSLEQFLTDRFALFTVSRERVFRADISHAPWPLQRATAHFSLNTMTAPLGIQLDGPPELHFSRSLDVQIDRLRSA
jgi:uncharacterized protein YqjF (DUF2071 family)